MTRVGAGNGTHLHLDIGGEGRHAGAINVNPARVTSTTGGPGRPVPNLVLGRGEALPIASGVADVVTVEHAPLRPGAADEIARVLKPGGIVRLLHPADYAGVAHDAVAGALGLELAARTTARVPGGSVLTTLRRAAALLR